MSTVPSTVVTEATEAIADTLTHLESTAATIAAETGATEASLDFGAIKEIMDAFDPAALLPDLAGMGEMVMSIARFAVLVGPLVLLALGLAYLFLAPKEANYRFGYRCYHGMGSVGAWRFTQRLAGLVWGGLGLVLTVVMLVISGSYGGKTVMDVVDSAVTCLIWEIVLVAASVIFVNVQVMLRYDKNGAPRRR